MKEGVGQIYTLSAPTAGWNARVPLPKVPEDCALSLINWFPDSWGVKKRNGTLRKTATAFTSGCETLIPYNKPDGTQKILACGDHTIQLVNADGTKTDNTNGCTITSNRWQYVQFYDKLFMVNGADRCLTYDGTTLTVAGFTYNGGADANLSNVQVYNERLWFTCQGVLYYGGTRYITGALTASTIQYQFQKGGALLFVGGSTWNLSQTALAVLVIATDQGEILIYSGDPNDTSWNLEGHFFIPRPVGPRAFFLFGAEMNIITELGVYRLSEIREGSSLEQLGRYIRASQEIDKAFAIAGQQFYSNFGWGACTYTRGDMLIVNVPVSATQSVQYVMSTLNGAWCQFQNINALSWCISNGYAYYGGIDGHVWQFDVGQNDGAYPSYGAAASYSGDAIVCSGQTAFTPCGDDRVNKAFKLIRPILTTDGDATLSIALNTNFLSNSTLTPVSITGSGNSAWDNDTWDNAAWADPDVAILDWTSVDGRGLNCSVVFGGSFKDVDIELLGFHIQFEGGGAL